MSTPLFETKRIRPSGNDRGTGVKRTFVSPGIVFREFGTGFADRRLLSLDQM
jgi:hypothetical protein